MVKIKQCLKTKFHNMKVNFLSLVVHYKHEEVQYIVRDGITYTKKEFVECRIKSCNYCGRKFIECDKNNYSSLSSRRLAVDGGDYSTHCCYPCGNLVIMRIS